ncbi:MAG: sugar ABC transporter permease [Armatimonadota bacterium]|nr:sugar ABC transporter permease [Armatimonadota bacterium]MDR7463430.1 sugar ABC transporter permease [Armatimonadota bacterium]MDR7470269.1 sugar ABC transporter permease [Armatimonadota bacterium]MDR7475368.1 sugar ABC transporter permease [Armatimonadota bacterium]MDR7539776.1 sugar ABC transporter permease [Armatimonadota bacterium]
MSAVLPGARARPRLLGLSRRQWRTTLVAYLFLLPALLLLSVFTFYPVGFGTVLSLFAYNLRTLLGLEPARFVGLEHFRALRTDRFFWIALTNTLQYVLVVPVLQFASILLAVAVNRRLRGIAWFRAAYYVPVITSMVVVGLLWRWLYEQDGIINYVLLSLGVIARPISWLGNPDLALYSVMFVTLWKGLGYYMVIYLAGLQAISPEYEEAATLDGAGRWQIFRYVTLPLLRPSILVASTISTIAALKVFEEVYVMTGGGPVFRTFTMFFYIFDVGFQKFDFGYAAALAVILAAGIMLLSAANFAVFRRGGYEYY